MKKEQIISFKVEKDLYEKLSSVKNKSEFIRKLILSYTNNICPFCNGNGFLSISQKGHYDSFLLNHNIKKCEKHDECTFIECKEIL